MEATNQLAKFKTLEQNCEEMSIICPTEPEARMRLRELISNHKKPWAMLALHKEFGFECLSKYCGMCSFHSSAEIAAERSYNE